MGFCRFPLWNRILIFFFCLEVALFGIRDSCFENLHLGFLLSQLGTLILLAAERILRNLGLGVVVFLVCICGLYLLLGILGNLNWGFYLEIGDFCFYF